MLYYINISQNYSYTIFYIGDLISKSVNIKIDNI